MKFVKAKRRFDVVKSLALEKSHASRPSIQYQQKSRSKIDHNADDIAVDIAVDDDHADDIAVGCENADHDSSSVDSSSCSSSRSKSEASSDDISLESSDDEPIDYSEDINVDMGEFNINEAIENDKKENRKKLVPPDSKKVLYPGNRNTVGSFAIAFAEVMAQFAILPAAEDEIFKVLYKYLPDVSWPVRVSTEREFISSQTRLYIPRKFSSVMTFDICGAHGCTAFVGNNSHLDACKKCGHNRFSKCNVDRCNFLKYSDCTHQISTRTPIKVLYYRPLVPMLQALIDTDGFYLALKYKFLKPSDQKKYQYMDVQDGAHCKTHIQDMHKRFNGFKKLNPDSNAKEISIAFSMFYDGTKVFKHKVYSFIPLMLSIINLPPTFKTKTGVGMFLVALFSGLKEGCEAENFLFSSCLIGELQQFHVGKEMTDSHGQSYFVQARLISYTLDGKAIEKSFNVNCSTANQYCPLCRIVHGVTRSPIGSVHFPGHRYTLPINHFLRKFGQSTICCPKGYYNCSEEVMNGRIKATLLEKETSKSTTTTGPTTKTNYQVMVQQNTNRSEVPRKINHKIALACDNNVTHDQLNEMTNPKNSNTEETWFNIEYDPTIFETVLFFEHCDYRKQIAYERVTNETYLRDAERAEQTNTVICGLKKPWIFRGLKYSKFDADFSYDPFHSIYGFLKLLMQIMKGERLTSSTISGYCMKANVHGSYIKKGTKKIIAPAAVGNQLKTASVSQQPTVLSRHPAPSEDEVSIGIELPDTKKSIKNGADKKGNTPDGPWVYRLSELYKFDAWINCILVPKAHGDSFQIVNPFEQTGMLRSIGYSHIFKSLVNLINLVASMGRDVKSNKIQQPYRTYFSLVGAVITRMTAPFFSDEDVDNLYLRTNEMLSLHEGLFPVSECTMICHELVDVVAYIKQMGPLKNWTTLDGERSLWHIKKHVVAGGANFEKTVIDRYDRHEQNKTRRAYNFNAENIFDQSRPDLQKKMISCENMSIRNLELNYNCNPVILKCPCSRYQFQFDFHQCEHEKLLITIISEIESRTNNVAHAMHKSPIYRLNYAYMFHSNRLHHKKTVSIFKGNLLDWFKALNQLYLQPDDSNSISAFIQLEDLNNDSPEFEANYSSGYILKSDLIAANQIINVNFTFYKKAMVFGEQFAARGREYRESSYPLQQDLNYGQQNEQIKYKPSNIKGAIRRLWKDKKMYSSWCRLRSKRTTYPEITYGSDFYGQLNFFFTLGISDEVIRDVAFASVTPRIFTVVAMVHKVLGDDYESFDKGLPYFVPVTDIYSTAILVLPVSKENGIERPICLGEKNVTENTRKYFSSEKKYNLNHFYFFDKSPERLGLCFERLDSENFKI